MCLCIIASLVCFGRDVTLTQIVRIELLLLQLGVMRDLPKIQEDGFFQGFSPLVCCVVVLEACGGLVVAVRAFLIPIW